MANTEPIHVGTTIEGKFVITRKKIALFGEATGDFNPIHFSTEAARSIWPSMMEDEVVAHGDLVLPCANYLFTERFPNIILKQRVFVDFVRPVKVRDEQEVCVFGTISRIEQVPKGRGWLCTIDVIYSVNSKKVIQSTQLAVLPNDITVESA